MKCAAIDELRSTHAVAPLCRALAVPRSTYYAWRARRPRHARRRPEGARVDEATLHREVARVFAESRGTYGSPRVYRTLQREGIHCGRARVARAMRAQGLVSHVARARRPARAADWHRAAAPNRLARQFAVGAGLDRRWGADLTFVPTQEGWSYLAVVLDLASRRVVGWAMSDRVDGALALQALERAVAARHPAPGLVHHTDRGITYMTHAYRACLAAHGMVRSHSRLGNCWDNAVVESFFATLKQELFGPRRRSFPTRSLAHIAIAEFIEVWYNRHRLHSSLQYRSPADYEAGLTA